MSTSDGQPPLTRRQIRDLERAREAGRAVTGAVPVVPASASAAEPAPTPEPTSSPEPMPAPRSAAASTSDDALPTPVPSTVARPDVPPPAPGSVVDPGTGLTRRQMRALRDADQSRGASPVPLQAPAPEPRRPLADALNTVDEIAPAAARPTSAPVGSSSADARPASAPAPRPSSADDASDVAPGPRRTGQTPLAAPAASAPAPTSTPTVFPFALSDEQGRGPQSSPSAPPASSRPTTSAPRASNAVTDDRRDDSSDVVPVVPPGHWSAQSDEPDAQSVPGRQLGTSTGQQNALILTDAQVADVTGALNATGEIIITGSIDLPRSLASTGSQARIDNSDMDRILEQGDAEQASSDAEPVRASRAISTHTSTRAVVLAASQPKGTHLPLILGISGGVVGLGIIGLIIGGFATGVLG
ncbi:hypothetical protein ITJ55_11635 [Frigoribacterium sp. VKM Ac-1396]|uniref:hypothetical protein n=1 Tax=Frigoribacterium sp. VKM Ac-1396 TaxID=2783821 RepID=UPI00188A9645|nr:hypothetical protein [Frigoribacterium sp. VKM Ac-1396]MBF4601459.1 hypothetical protein [Frigoribacterium sp. VKM Ac-1396]